MTSCYFEAKISKLLLRFFENFDYFTQLRKERLLFIIYAFIKKCLLIQQIMIILGGCVFQLVSGCKVVDSVPVLGINAIYIADTLRGVKD